MDDTKLDKIVDSNLAVDAVYSQFVWTLIDWLLLFNAGIHILQKIRFLGRRLSHTYMKDRLCTQDCTCWYNVLHKKKIFQRSHSGKHHVNNATILLFTGLNTIVSMPFMPLHPPERHSQPTTNYTDITATAGTGNNKQFWAFKTCIEDVNSFSSASVDSNFLYRDW